MTWRTSRLIDDIIYTKKKWESFLKIISQHFDDQKEMINFAYYNDKMQTQGNEKKIDLIHGYKGNRYYIFNIAFIILNDFSRITT